MFLALIILYFLVIWDEISECEVGRNLKEKFETFLEEGLLDPLLQYIVKDSEKEIDFKVGSIFKPFKIFYKKLWPQLHNTDDEEADSFKTNNERKSQVTNLEKKGDHQIVEEKDK